MFKCMCACWYACNHAFIHAHTHAHMHACTNACMQACMHACVHPCVCACVRACINHIKGRNLVISSYNITVYLFFESIEWCNNQYPCTQTERPKWQQYFCHGSGTVCLTPWKKCKCYCGIFVHGPVHWILTSTKISRDGVITRKNTIQDEFRQTNW